MVTKEIRELLKQAITDLSIAEYEINRPTRDSVTLSACLCARQSMKSMMRLFLLTHSINHNESTSLKELINQCIQVDKQFASIDISNINCSELNHAACDGMYCLSLENVSDCIGAGNKMKAIVLDNLRINEREMYATR